MNTKPTLMKIYFQVLSNTLNNFT